MNPPRSRRTYYLTIGKTVVTVALLAWLFQQIDLHRTAIRWQEAEWSYLVLVGPLVFLSCLLLNVLRWKLLLNTQNIYPPFVNLAIILTKGAFLGTFLAGGKTTADIYQMYSLTRNTRDSDVSISSVLLARVSAIFALLILCVGGLLYLVFQMKNQIFQPVLRPVILVIVLCSAVIVGVFLSWRFSVQRPNWKHPVFVKIQSFLDTLPRYFAHKDVILKVLLLSVSLQLFVVWWNYAVSQALHLSVSFVELSITVPLIILVSLVPISLAGFGVRETAYVYFLVPFGLTPGEATSLGLLNVLVLNGLLLISGVLLFLTPEPAFVNTPSGGQGTPAEVEEQM